MGRHERERGGMEDYRVLVRANGSLEKRQLKGEKAEGGMGLGNDFRVWGLRSVSDTVNL